MLSCIFLTLESCSKTSLQFAVDGWLRLVRFDHTFNPFTLCLGKFLVVDMAKQDIREIQQDAKDAAKAAAAQAARPVSAGVNGTTCVAGHHQQDFVSCCTAFMAHVCGDVISIITLSEISEIWTR